MPALESVNEIDLSSLARALQEELGGQPAEGYLRGKTVLRDALVRRLRCSDLEAEELVDTMEAQGYLRFSADPAERAVATATWSIHPR